MLTGDLSWPLQRAAALHADRVAVVDGERRVTYGELARRVGALGGALAQLDAGRVGWLGVNSLAHLECWLGVPASGRVLVDLNFRLALEELAFICDDSGVEVLIVAFKQPIAASDPLRTGTYAKTLTFTLSTTNP